MMPSTRVWRHSEEDGLVSYDFAEDRFYYLR
jgi:hypothetical protein